ncbi:unnamed protein product [Brassica rapa subsp. narinosa]|uniref:Arp2/3 complex 34 kDa subunit n=2 Tax=Brassica napus TaxID=3708 RepID=A0A817B8G5_BRANA|nr:unnamed protein product [Brassica napus]
MKNLRDAFLSAVLYVSTVIILCNPPSRITGKKDVELVRGGDMYVNEVKSLRILTFRVSYFWTKTFELVEYIMGWVAYMLDWTRRYNIFGGISGDITSRHVEGKRLDKTVWNLLNFYAYVEYHIKCSRGYIQRRMRKGMDSLVKLLNNTSLEEVPQKGIFFSSGFASYIRFLTFCINKMEDANTLIKKLVKVQKGKLMMKRQTDFSSNPSNKSYTKLP